MIPLKVGDIVRLRKTASLREFRLESDENRDGFSDTMPGMPASGLDSQSQAGTKSKGNTPG